MKTIYADKLINEIVFHTNFPTDIKEEIEDIIQNAPPVEPIVRCKDCKNFIKWRSEESAKQFGQIYDCARGVFACPEPKDFCSHAERRTDGTD